MARRVPRAIRQANRQPSLENLHELRKRVKDRYYQQRYFQQIQYSGEKLSQQQLWRIGHQLGAARDLTLLMQSMATAPITPARESFLTKIEALAMRYQRNAMRKTK